MNLEPGGIVEDRTHANEPAVEAYVCRCDSLDGEGRFNTRIDCLAESFMKTTIGFTVEFTQVFKVQVAAEQVHRSLNGRNRCTTTRPSVSPSTAAISRA